MELNSPILALFAIPFVYLGLFGLFIYRYKVKQGSLEFRVILYMFILLIINVGNTILIFGIFDNAFIAQGIFYPSGIACMILTIPFAIKAIQNQEKLIKIKQDIMNILIFLILTIQ